MKGLFALANLGLVLCALGCAPHRAVRTATAASSPFRVAVEGACPKLDVQRAGETTLLVYGTYGFEDEAVAGWGAGRPSGRARQAIATVRDGKAVPSLHLLAGLPRTDGGYASGDLVVGGTLPDDAWLGRTERRAAAPKEGALFAMTHSSYAWADGAWREAEGTGPRVVHATPPSLEELCARATSAVSLSLLAAEHAPDGTTWIATRCEDEHHRAIGPMRIAKLRPGGAWTVAPIPESDLFAGLVNAGILPLSGDEAYVWAYRPFGEGEPAPAYLVHHRAGDAVAVDAPTAGPIVSVARTDDASLWMVSGFDSLHHRRVDGTWANVTVPAPRLLEVRATGNDVWIHGAYPIDRDGVGARRHVLYTTAPWDQPLYCDRDRPAAEALGIRPSATRTPS